jgi:hypothetical protein
MDQKIFFVILIIFLLTSEFYLIIKNTIKYGIYLLVIIYILKIINPNLSKYIKSILNNLINSDENMLMSIFSNLIKYFKSSIGIKTNVPSNVFDNHQILLNKKKNLIKQNHTKTKHINTLQKSRIKR